MKPFYSVDLFAGCGGLSLGLNQAGFETLLFSEVNKNAADTFEKNLGHDHLVRCEGIESLTTARLREYRNQWAAEGKSVDLVTGGPPCQGYSGIGHRRTQTVDRVDVPSNHLYKNMVRAIRVLEPNLFLFENVRGLISGRWWPGGEKGKIWDDVRGEFASLDDYQIGWKLVFAKDFGVPQNRPRIILVGAHKRLGLRLGDDNPENRLDNPRGLIPIGRSTPPHLEMVLSDLVDRKYSRKTKTDSYVRKPRSSFQRAMRKPHGGRTFRIGDELTEHDYTIHSERIRDKFALMLTPNACIPEDLRTRKFAQRVLPRRWGKDGPTITATSLPDDFVHFEQPRILTVREWARLQMFPDWFQFCGPRTTGGHRRAGRPSEGFWERELPKYTQIGNAVPVGLARGLGCHLAHLLNKAKNQQEANTPHLRRLA